MALSVRFISRRVIGENETDNAFVKKPDASEQQAQSRTISYDDYRRIARELVHRLHINEVQAQADAVEKGYVHGETPASRNYLLFLM
jgi:hypothetical protein